MVVRGTGWFDVEVAGGVTCEQGWAVEKAMFFTEASANGCHRYSESSRIAVLSTG
jgi:hypothetical protein